MEDQFLIEKEANLARRAVHYAAKPLNAMSDFGAKFTGGQGARYGTMARRQARLAARSKALANAPKPVVDSNKFLSDVRRMQEQFANTNITRGDFSSIPIVNKSTPAKILKFRSSTKTAGFDDIYNEAFVDELEKVAAFAML